MHGRRVFTHTSLRLPTHLPYHPHMHQRARKPRNEHLVCSFRGCRACWHTSFPRACIGTGYPSPCPPARPPYHPRMCQRAQKPRNKHLVCSFHGYCARWHTGFPCARMGTGYPSSHPPALPPTRAPACTEATKRAPSVLVSLLSCMLVILRVHAQPILWPQPHQPLSTSA
jgi:hypothetical protein